MTFLLTFFWSVQLVGRIHLPCLQLRSCHAPTQGIFRTVDRTGTFGTPMSRPFEARLLYFRNWSKAYDSEELGSSDPNNSRTKGFPSEEYANWQIGFSFTVG